MTRDIRQEKKVRLISWLVWKVSAVIYVILAVGLIGAFLAEKMGWKSPSPAPQDTLLLFGNAIMYGVFGCLFWWTGRALARLKSWAWWLTTIGLVINLVSTIVVAAAVLIPALMNPGDSKKALPLVAIAVVVFFFTLFYGWMVKVLAGKRGRRLFTDEYRNRLKHGSFEKFKVTPEK